MSQSRWEDLIARVPQDRDIIGAEVGVWQGKMSECLLRGLPNLRTLHLVDRWAPPEDGDSYKGSGSLIALKPQEEHTAALHATHRRLKPYKGRVSYLVGDSAGMAKFVDDDSLDFVFIDGDHSYAGVTRDIRAWLPKVKAGGLMGGHDWGKADKGDVQGAVTDFFGQTNKIEVKGSCWWVQFPKE